MCLLFCSNLKCERVLLLMFVVFSRNLKCENRVSLMLCSIIFSKESYVIIINTSLLPYRQQQKFSEHVNDHGRSIQRRERWRWISLHGLCFSRNVWIMTCRNYSRYLSDMLHSNSNILTHFNHWNSTSGCGHSSLVTLPWNVESTLCMHQFLNIWKTFLLRMLYLQHLLRGWQFTCNS